MVVPSELVTTNAFEVHFGQRAIDSCIRSQRQALNHYQAVLVCQPSCPAEDIERAAEVVMASEPGLPLSGFNVTGNKILLGALDHRYLAVPLIGQVIYGANQKLGVFEYLAPLVSGSTTRRDLPPFEKRYPWNGRLEHIKQAGGFLQNSPELQFLAVAFAGQAAINIANEEGQRLVRTSEQAVAVNGLIDFEGIQRFFTQRLSRMRQHQAFIKECSATLARIAERGQFTQDRQRLLLDLAFIHKDGLEKEGEFGDFFKPIVQLVAQGNWQEAEACRDFLLRCFPGLFPDWRQRESGVEPAGRSAGSIDQLAGQIAAGEVVTAEIPPAYEFLKDRLPQSMDRVQKERNRQILKDGIDVSTVMVRELARELVKKNIFDSRQKRADLLELINRGDILDELFNLSFTEREEEEWNRFVRVVDRDFLPGQTVDSLRWFFNDLRKGLTPPYELRGRSARRVAMLKPIEFQNNGHGRQVYMVSPPDDYGDFGALLGEIIEASLTPSAFQPVLGRDGVKSALTRAWQLAGKKLTGVTLKDYLMILVKPAPNSPVAQFIEEV